MILPKVVPLVLTRFIKREKPTFSNFLAILPKVVPLFLRIFTMREMWFLILAVALATLTTFLADISQSFEFSIGVAFIGYFVAATIALVTIFGD